MDLYEIASLEALSEIRKMIDSLGAPRGMGEAAKFHHLKEMDFRSITLQDFNLITDQLGKRGKRIVMEVVLK